MISKLMEYISLLEYSMLQWRHWMIHFDETLLFQAAVNHHCVLMLVHLDYPHLLSYLHFLTVMLHGLKKRTKSLII